MNKKSEKFYIPEFVSIEITNHCNFKCIICPHGHDLITNKGYMSFEIYKKIIDELYENKINPRKIALFGIGESLLHPEFIKMANYSKSKGFYQQLTTNALFLTPEKSDEILKNECIDRLELSFDNNEQNYKMFKGGNVYKITLNNIKYLLSKEKNKNIYIKLIQYDLQKENKQVSDDLKEIFKDNKNVYFVLYNISTWRGSLEMDFLSKETKKMIDTPISDTPDMKKCNNGADMAPFSWDGYLKSCYMDYKPEHVFGNIKDNNLLDLLMCEDRKKFIDNIVSGNHRLNHICKNCLSPYNRKSQSIVIQNVDDKLYKITGSQNDAYEKLETK